MRTGSSSSASQVRRRRTTRRATMLPWATSMGSIICPMLPGKVALLSTTASAPALPADDAGSAYDSAMYFA